MTPEPLDFSGPRALSLRLRDRSPFLRLVAHLLLRLMIVGPLPADIQAWAALFPASILWPVVRPDADAPLPASGSRRAAEPGVDAPTSGPSGYDGERRGRGDRSQGFAGKYDRGCSARPFYDGRALYPGATPACVLAYDRAFPGTTPSATSALHGARAQRPAAPSGDSRIAKARFYDPEYGRFISQDSYLGEIDNPPSLHRYFYADANPLRYVDPDGHDDRAARELVAGLGKTGVYGFNTGAEQVAAPVTSRLEGVLNLVIPISYLRDQRGEASSYTRRVQNSLIDKATSRNEGTGTRLASGVGAALLQPGAALNDIAHGIVGVPGILREARQHLAQALNAESGLGFVHETLEAIERGSGAAETTLGAMILARGAARMQIEGRPAARDRGMASAVLRERQQLGAPPEATFSQRMGPDATSRVEESIPAEDGNRVHDVHAEQLVMGPGTVVVDQNPCLRCMRDLDINGARVIVLQDPAMPDRAVKNTAVRASEGRGTAVPRVVTENRNSAGVPAPTLPVAPRQADDSDER